MYIEFCSCGTGMINNQVVKFDTGERTNLNTLLESWFHAELFESGFASTGCSEAGCFGRTWFLDRTDPIHQHGQMCMGYEQVIDFRNPENAGWRRVSRCFEQDGFPSSVLIPKETGLLISSELRSLQHNLTHPGWGRPRLRQRVPSTAMKRGRAPAS